MKMKTIDVVNIMRGILMYRSVPERWPVALNHAVNTNFRKLRPHQEAYDDTMEELNDRHVLRDDKNKPVLVKPDDPNTAKIADPSAYTKDIKEVSLREIDVDIHPIDLKLLPDPFPANIQALLDPLFQREEI